MPLFIALLLAAQGIAALPTLPFFAHVAIDILTARTCSLPSRAGSSSARTGRYYEAEPRVHRLGPEGLSDTLRVPWASKGRRFFFQRFVNLTKRRPRRRIGLYEVNMIVYTRKYRSITHSLQFFDENPCFSSCFLFINAEIPLIHKYVRHQ